MKKKSAKRHINKIVQRQISQPLIPPQSILIISGFVAVLVAVFIVANKRVVTQSVQGIAIVRGLFNEATIYLPPTSGAVSYNIYYGQGDLKNVLFTHAVRKIPATLSTYTIQYLKKNTPYKYQISALNSQGKEIWFSPVTPVTNIQGM